MVRRLTGPRRTGNRFTLVSDGREYFTRMLSAINASHDYILAEFYLVESGAVADAFIAAFVGASARGVRVRAIFDGFGARGLTDRDRARLRDGGVSFVFYNKPRWGAFTNLFLRDHRKLLIADGATGFTGGVGIMDAFSPDAHPESYWRDCMLEMTGPVLIDWHVLFANTWRRCLHRELDVAPRQSATLYPGESGRLVASAGLGRQDVGRSIVNRVQNAKSRAWIATAYFWPSMRLRRALRRAARRGTDVRLVLTGRYTDAPLVRRVGRLFYARLLANGIVIYEYRQRFLHCKLALCDDWASVGSSNFDRWGALWNLEANQEIESPVFAAQVEATFRQICEDSAVLRHPRDVEHHWSVYIWWHVARVVFSWSTRAVSRLRR